ncbi:MAG: hypothetical protein GXY44_08115 [Phycisphaerales bacterium]|nr:hypothetical protein [Phycisphaerales bacterium]
MRSDAKLLCGDDLIVFGTGMLNGVSYIVPSETPTVGTPVPNDAVFRSKSFAVAKRTIFLVDGMFQVSVFNVDEDVAPATIPEADLRLANIPAGAKDAGHLQADGDYCVVRCDGGNVIRVIDVSGGAPVILPLTNPPDVTTGFGVQQVAIDAASMRVIAAAGNPRALYVYDLNNPADAPAAIALPNDISNNVQMKVNGNFLVALDDQAYKQLLLVDLEAGEIVELAEANAIADVAVGPDAFAFFADLDADDSVGGDRRAAAGALPGPDFAKAALGNQIDGSTNNNGLVGFAGSMCIVPAGDYAGYLFLANSYLQYSPGGVAFTVPADPDGDDPWACPAWDVDASRNTVGFKTATTRSDNTETTVGYIILEND